MYAWMRGMPVCLDAWHAMQVLCEEGDSLLYLYDAAICWQHTVKLERWLSPGEEGIAAHRHNVVPACVVGEKACPPEGCGGPRGYLEWCEKVARPQREVGQRQPLEGAHGPPPEGAQGAVEAAPPDSGVSEAERQELLAWAAERVGSTSVALTGQPGRDGGGDSQEGGEGSLSWDAEAFSPDKATRAMQRALQRMQQDPHSSDSGSDEDLSDGDNSLHSDGMYADSAAAEGGNWQDSSDEGLISGLDDDSDEWEDAGHT